MSKSSKQWLQRQKKDIYVQQAQQHHYRSRSVYKLKEIDKKYGLLKNGQVVVELGAAPGGWSQYICEQTNGLLIAVDLLPIQPIPCVKTIEGDITSQHTLQTCLDTLLNKKADLVLSDMAPNLSGIRHADQARSMELIEITSTFAKETLKQGGTMVVKVFEGEGIKSYKQSLNDYFKEVYSFKPRASRVQSRENYILAINYQIS